MTHGLSETLNDLSKSLAILAIQVRAEALAGFGSRNKIAEHVMLPVLRRVYAAPGLSNTNAVSANYPGIDLYDPATGLGVQITSDTTPTKISATIDTLIAQGVPIKHLVVAIIAERGPRYRSTTRAGWKSSVNGAFDFDPDLDVFAFEQLFARIQLLSYSDILQIAEELRALVQGAHSIHLIPHLQEQAKGQLAEERRVARYIPDIFVETQDTKYQARCFTYPTLFIRRIAEWFDRDPYAGLNRLAKMSGVPVVTRPAATDLTTSRTPQEASDAAISYVEQLAVLEETLKAYSNITKPEGARISRTAAYAHVLAETKYYIEMFAHGAQYRLSDRMTELKCISARIFLLTGPAGQGKTNFLCDFTERFLLRHQIPCAYITARQLSRLPEPDLADALRKLIFPQSVQNLEEGLSSLALPCAEIGKPFVLVIDGLNEHPDVRVFAGQLEYLLERLVSFPHVRVLMTCRSEFLSQRFGNLLSGKVSHVLQISQAHGQRFGDTQFKELVARYFRFFRVRRSRVSSAVIDFLHRDVLLLRFFCEAYGKRGKPTTYEQPVIVGIYRGEIFRRYLDEKLDRARGTIERNWSVARPLATPPPLKRVLSLIAAHMLDTGQFANVPRGIVPAALDHELTALLDEELILRQDLGAEVSALSESEDVLNFTFDEMRDFLLAQYLLEVYAKDPQRFANLVQAQQPTAVQSVEGLQRFLFYASREPENDAFFDFYSRHPWYEAVYDTEIFAIPPEHVSDHDRQIVEAALEGGGSRAQHFARRISYRWQSTVWPVLNLGLLLDVAERAAPGFYASVIEPTFGSAPYRERTLAAAFCGFVDSEVLPTFSPEYDEIYGVLFRLLILLLPIGATPTLESPAGTTFRQLIAVFPRYAAGLLRSALAGSPNADRAFVWRLLTTCVGGIEDTAGLLEIAKQDVAARSSEPPLRREAGRFMARVLGEQPVT